MNEFTDLEIGLHRRSTDTYAVELRCTRPDSDADTSRDGEAQFDLAALQELANDPAAYGKTLHASLFADPDVLSTFGEVRAISQDKERPLRLRLMIGPSAPELNSLRWETLRDPQTNLSLSTSQNILFTRYLSSMDWRAVRRRPKSDLRALVVIANPSDLAAYNLAPIDVPGESTRAKNSLGDIPVTFLPDGDRKATLQNIIACLNESQYDILYLVCHGALVKDEPRLWLEDDAGMVARVAGIDLATQLTELQEHPRLAVLASCQSASSGAGSALTALGPRLAQAGIPAVMAMQDNISMETVAQFMPVFFKELQKDGQIDRAMAVARGVVRDRPDSWMPALFMRLKSGRIWYIPSFGGGPTDGEDFEKWESLKRSIKRQICTPFIGPGVAETLLGSQSEIAFRWAKENRYPFAPYDRESLPSIAQYIVRRGSPQDLRDAFQEALQLEIVRRCGDHLPADLRDDHPWSKEDLLGALTLASEQCWAGHPNDPHRLLAELRLPIYITTSPGDLLMNAITHAGGDPQRRICPWWGDQMNIPPEIWDFDERPTPKRPLVYHLFGHISIPESLVLSEDNYFDFLIGVTRNIYMKKIPYSILNAMTSAALLFLGFRTEEWSFRVLFRTLMAQPGSERLKNYSHVAAQIEPEEDRLLDARRARRHLEQYFQSEKISIYWGRPEEFLSALANHMEVGHE